MDFQLDNNILMEEKKNHALKNVNQEKCSCFESHLQILPTFSRIIAYLCKRIEHWRNIIHEESLYFDNLYQIIGNIADFQLNNVLLVRETQTKIS